MDAPNVKERRWQQRFSNIGRLNFHNCSFDFGYFCVRVSQWQPATKRQKQLTAENTKGAEKGKS
jgi:hypothetical protein